jgi:peptidoglycan/xylan/chitin deacetylase (PgdA/CDA1 family)
MPDTHGLCVDIDDFRGHMMHLRQHYCPMTLHEFAQAAGAANLPPGAVAVTLDDGYLNCLTTISPILLEFGIPATFFVNTERLGEQHEFWWDTLERVFLSEFPIPSFLDLYADGRWVRHTRTEEERVAVHTALFEAIYSMLPEDRHTAVRRVAAWSGMDLSPRPTHRPMTTDEILQLAVRPGHSIGAHTTHHLSLPLQPLDVQRREIFENKACLERLTGRPTTAFSYPYGEFSRQTMEIVREAGFEIAVTVENRVVRLGAERLLLPRFEIKSCKVDDFVRLLKEICAG